MEKEIEDIKKRVEDFMKKYNCSVKIEALCEGRYLDGKIIRPKAVFIINS